MKRIALLSVAVLLFWTACADQPEGPQALLTGPSAAVTQAPPTTATVCLAYGKELESVKALAAAGPDTAGLQRRADALSAVIADACR